MATDIADVRPHAWLIGCVNGAIVLALIPLLYALASGGEWYPHTVLLAVPFAVVTAWRGAQFVKRLRRGDAKFYQGALEGFLVLAGAAVVYLVPTIIRAHVAGADPQGWGWPFWRLFFGYTAFYAIIVGFLGAIVGAALSVLDVLLVDLWSRPKPG